MLRGTCYYNKKIKVENVAESAKIVTNVQTFRDCALTFVSGLCPDICYDFGTFSNILNFYFLIDSQTVLGPVSRKSRNFSGVFRVT